MVRIIESDTMAYDSIGSVETTSIDDMTVKQIFDISDILQILIDSGIIPDEPYTIYAAETCLREGMKKLYRHNRRSR